MDKNYIWDKRTDSELFLMPKKCEENYLNTPNMPTSNKIIAPKKMIYDILGERGIITASVAKHQKGFYLEILKSKHLQLSFTVSGLARIKTKENKFLAKENFYFIASDESNYAYDAYKSWEVFWFHLNPKSFWKDFFPKDAQMRKSHDAGSILTAMQLYLSQIHNPNCSILVLEKNADLIVELLKKELSFEAKANQNPLENLIKKASQDFTKSYTLKELADSAEMSIATLNRLSIKSYGVTFGKLITKNKLKYAKKMLLESKFTNLEIAKALGYSSESAFSKSFKNHYGFAPSSIKANSIKF